MYFSALRQWNGFSSFVVLSAGGSQECYEIVAADINCVTAVPSQDWENEEKEAGIIL